MLGFAYFSPSYSTCLSPPALHLPPLWPGPLYAHLIPETQVPLRLHEILFPTLNLFQTIGNSSSNLFSRQMIWNICKTGKDCRPSAELRGLDFGFSLGLWAVSTPLLSPDTALLPFLNVLHPRVALSPPAPCLHSLQFLFHNVHLFS